MPILEVARGRAGAGGVGPRLRVPSVEEVGYPHAQPQPVEEDVADDDVGVEHEIGGNGAGGVGRHGGTRAHEASERGGGERALLEGHPAPHLVARQVADVVDVALGVARLLREQVPGVVGPELHWLHQQPGPQVGAGDLALIEVLPVDDGVGVLHIVSVGAEGEEAEREADVGLQRLRLFVLQRLPGGDVRQVVGAGGVHRLAEEPLHRQRVESPHVAAAKGDVGGVGEGGVVEAHPGVQRLRGGEGVLAEDVRAQLFGGPLQTAVGDPVGGVGVVAKVPHRVCIGEGEGDARGEGVVLRELQLLVLEAHSEAQIVAVDEQVAGGADGHVLGDHHRFVGSQNGRQVGADVAERVAGDGPAEARRRGSDVALPELNHRRRGGVGRQGGRVTPVNAELRCGPGRRRLELVAGVVWVPSPVDSS